MTTLDILFSKDYSNTPLFQIDTLDFKAPADAVFRGSQFVANQLPSDLHIDGSSGVNRVIVNADIRGFNGAQFTYTNWQAEDRLVIRGTVFNDVLAGSIMNDEISGGSGRDTIFGGGGSDIIEGGAGADSLTGGAGNDWLSYESSSAAVTVDLAGQKAWGGDAVGDKVTGFESAIGGTGNDVLKGSSGNNRLAGGLGADTLTGGKGADRFTFFDWRDSQPGSGRDRIADFSRSDGDRIDVSEVDAIAYTDSRIDEFRFIGTGPFQEAGDLRVMKSGSLTLVQGDVDGDRSVDFEIALSGSFTLTADDFIL